MVIDMDGVGPNLTSGLLESAAMTLCYINKKLYKNWDLRSFIPYFVVFENRYRIPITSLVSN
jgi:hypothetical protein